MRRARAASEARAYRRLNSPSPTDDDTTGLGDDKSGSWLNAFLVVAWALVAVRTFHAAPLPSPAKRTPTCRAARPHRGGVVPGDADLTGRVKESPAVNHLGRRAVSADTTTTPAQENPP